MGFADYLTPLPPQVNGLSMFNDVLESLAKRKQQMQIEQMQDAQRREAARLEAQGRSAALSETGRHNRAGETQAQGALSETGRHNLATEEGAKATDARERAVALSRALLAPGAQAALAGTDTGQVDTMAPGLTALGAQVRRPGPGPDDTLPMAGEPAPEDNRRELVGPGGAPLMTFDPATNAIIRARRASEARTRAADAAKGLNSFDAAGMEAGGAAAALAAESGATPTEAAKAGQTYATSSAGQASGRANAQTAAAAQGARTDKTGDRLDRKDARTEAQNLEKAYQLEENRDKYRFTSEAMRKLVKNNGLLTKQVLFSLAKANDSGKLSDQDYARSVGGADIGTRIKSWISGQLQGDLSGAEKARIADALKVEHRTIETRLQNAQRQYDGLVEDPVFDTSRAYLEGRRKRMFGDLPWNAGKLKPTTKPPKGAAPAPAGAGGGTTSARAGGEGSDDRLRKLLEGISNKYGVTP